MQPDYILILGGPVRDGKPGQILYERIKKAAELLRENPDAKAVCSGGIKSDRQKLSEAQIIKNTLLGLGIDGERILLEPKAKTTVENFKFTKEMLPSDAGVAFVTSKFHIKRSIIIMKKAGVDYIPVASENGSDSLSFRIREIPLLLLAKMGIVL